MFRNKKFNPFFVLFVLILSLSTSGQEPWNLERCINYALENNIQIKQQELNVRVNENLYSQSKLNQFPNLNAGANQNVYFGRAIDDQNVVSKDITSSNFSISSSVTLFSGFQIANTRKQNEVNLQASISDVAVLKNNISLNIASAYLQILYYEELLETSKKQVELSQLQKERTAMLVNAGSLPEGNLFEIEAQLASDELQFVVSQNQLDMSYLVLIQMLDLKSIDGFRILKPNIEGLEDDALINSPNTIYEESLKFLPQIKGAGLRVLSAEKKLQIDKGGHSPRLTASASYGSRSNWYFEENPPFQINDPFIEQIKRNATTSFGVTLSIPIFNNFQVRTSVSNAFISLENAKYSLEQEKNILYKDIQQAYADAIAALKKFKASEKSVVALEEAFRYAEQRFNLGLVNSLDYTTSKTRLTRAQADLLSAKYEYIFKTKILDFYQGNPLSL